MKTPNNTANLSALFTVCRPCEDGLCPATLGGLCSCHGATGVEVDVDELTEEELRHFTAHGSPAQKALLASYFGPVAVRFTDRELAWLDTAA